MPEFKLSAEPFLGGYRKTAEGVELAEVIDLSLVSIAVPLGGRRTLEETMAAAYGAALPEAGGSTRAKDGRTVFLGLAADQFLAALPVNDGPATGEIAGKLGAAGYYTEQSDNWVILRLSGANARIALERICPLDLHPDVFPVGQAARTVMEHLGAIVFREEADTFLLMSPSSSANSFLHAIETSIHNAT